MLLFCLTDIGFKFHFHKKSPPNFAATLAYDVDDVLNSRTSDSCSDTAQCKKTTTEKKRELVDFDSSQEWDSSEMPPPPSSSSSRSENQRENCKKLKKEEENSECTNKETSNKSVDTNSDSCREEKLQNDDEDILERKPDKAIKTDEKIEAARNTAESDNKDDDLIDIMLCAICSDIMHNCVW